MTENEIVTNNMGLVHMMAQKFQPQKPQQYDDLVSLGMESLLQASRTYDEKKGSFSAYACRNMWWRMSKHVTKETQFYAQHHLVAEYTTGSSNDPESLDNFMPAYLSQIERQIIKMKAAGHTLTKISKKLRMTYGKCYAIYHKLIKKLKRANA